MLKYLMILTAVMFLGVSFVHAGPPLVTEKPIVQASDGSYSIEDKENKDEIQILEAGDMAALSDQKLLDVYMDAAVEIEASKAFHSTSGFSPKQYKQYKALLKYRLRLLMELQHRKLDVPPVTN